MKSKIIRLFLTFLSLAFLSFGTTHVLAAEDIVEPIETTPATSFPTLSVSGTLRRMLPTPTPTIPTVKNSTLSCKVHTFLVNESYKLPYKFDTPELAQGSTLNKGNYIIYMFEVHSMTFEQKQLKKVTVSQLMQGNEPIEIVSVKGQDGYMTNINQATKSITNDLNYSFVESVYYPTEYLLKITDNPNDYPKTSSLFTIEVAGYGNIECASMHWIKDDTQANKIDWGTEYARLQSSDFYIKIGDKKFYGKEPVSIHSDPGSGMTTTLEATWHENGVEMRLFMYFRKTENNMWEMYDLRTYNAQSSNPDWFYYRDSLGNPVKSLIGYHNYMYERTFKEPTYNAEIYCKDCDINAFMPRQIPVSESGYSLEALLGLPKNEVITLIKDTNTGYGVNVLLRDLNGTIVKDQSNFTYTWEAKQPQTVKINAFSVKDEKGNCLFGINSPCPKMHADLEGIKAGETQIEVKVTRTTDNVVIAQTSFPVKVLEKDKEAEKAKQAKLAELQKKINDLEKKVNQQQSAIDRLSQTVENLRQTISRFFGRLFK